MRLGSRAVRREAVVSGTRWAGQILDDPLVVASANGKWDLFALGSDHALWTQTNLGSGWLGWSSPWRRIRPPVRSQQYPLMGA